MPVLDRRLVRPSVAELLECLAEASEYAGLERDVESWREFLDEVRGQREGVQRWGDLYYKVLLAWWTDAEQRRHFRVQSVPARDGCSDQLALQDSDGYSPLWYIYPERVVRRLTGEKPSWVVLCDCGRVGKVERLPWMGDRCASCSVSPERSVEWNLGAGAYLHQPDLVAERVAFSPNGRLIAIAGKEPFLDVWDGVGRSLVRRLLIGPGPIRAVAFLDGADPWVAVNCDDRLLRFFRVETGEEGGSIPTPSPLRQVEFLPGGNLLLMIAANGGEFWGRAGPSDPWRLVEDIPDRFPCPMAEELSRGKWVKWEDEGAGASRLAFTSDGRWVALAGEFTIRLWRCEGGRPALHWMWRDEQHPASSVAFHRGEETLYGLWHEPYRHRLRGGAYSVYAWGLDRSTPRDTWEGSYEARSPVMTPGGYWVVSRDEHSLCLNPTDRFRDRIRLEDHPRHRLRSVWASPDGETLASIDEHGRVRLWPWREFPLT